MTNTHASPIPDPVPGAPANSVHMPTNFDPAAYEYVESFDSEGWPGCYIGTPGDFTMPDGSVVTGTNWLNAHDSWLKGLLRRSPTSRWYERGQCDHCGARIRYVAVLRHLPTGDHIAVGETCLDTRASLASKADFDRMRKASAEARAEMRIKSLRDEFFVRYPDLEAILWPVPERWNGTYAARVLGDMNRTLRRYGELSEKQIAFARKLASEADEQAGRAERIAAEREAASPVPATTGRTTVVGTVVSRKWHESDFGGSYKLTVKHADGWCVWVSEPSSLECEVGDTIRFDCQLQVSDRDPKFAFGNRPTKATVITHTEVAQ